MLNALIGFGGILFLLFFAWLISDNKRTINWHAIGWGLVLQAFFALFVFVFPVGTKVFLFLNDVVLKVLDCAMAGTKFVFGRLALGPGMVDESGQTSLGFIMAFQAFPTIVFLPHWLDYCTILASCNLSSVFSIVFTSNAYQRCGIIIYCFEYFRRYRIGDHDSTTG